MRKKIVILIGILLVCTTIIIIVILNKNIKQNRMVEKYIKDKYGMSVRVKDISYHWYTGVPRGMHLTFTGQYHIQLAPIEGMALYAKIPSNTEKLTERELGRLQLNIEDIELAKTIKKYIENRTKMTCKINSCNRDYYNREYEFEVLLDHKHCVRGTIPIDKELEKIMIKYNPDNIEIR